MKLGRRRRGLLRDFQIFADLRLTMVSSSSLLACVLCTDPSHGDEEDDPQTVDDDLEAGEAGAQQVVAEDGGHDDAVPDYRPVHQQHRVKINFKIRSYILILFNNCLMNSWCFHVQRS